jgi:hypothetical protein
MKSFAAMGRQGPIITKRESRIDRVLGDEASPSSWLRTLPQKKMARIAPRRIFRREKT